MCTDINQNTQRPSVSRAIDDDVLLCDTCELNNEAPCLPGNKISHVASHPVVRYQHITLEEAETVEGRLLALEKRFADHEQAMASRLSVMENLLRTIATGR
jgi:hypothetical protein